MVSIFLGWTFKKFQNKLIVKPSKESIKNVTKKCSTIILREGKASTQQDLIRRLNQVLNGCTNYHNHVVSSKAFSTINNNVYLILQRWAKHRYPNKNKWWRLNRYWHAKDIRRWVFSTNDIELINLKRIKIVRHLKLQINKNPFIDKEYFDKRKIRLRMAIAARNGEGMLEPYERETLTYGS